MSFERCIHRVTKVRNIEYKTETICFCEQHLDRSIFILNCASFDVGNTGTDVNYFPDMTSTTNPQFLRAILIKHDVFLRLKIETLLSRIMSYY